VQQLFSVGGIVQKIAIASAACALALWGAPAGALPPDDLPYSQVIEPGYAVTPYALGVVAPSSLAFGPDGNLYLATVAGTIFRFRDIAGVVAGPPEPFVATLNYPLGLAWGPDGALYSTSVDVDNTRDGRTWGMIVRIPVDAQGNAGAPEKLLVDLPNGHSQANGLAFGPDGLLYLAIGSSTDDGVHGGPPEVPPLSGSVLRFDAMHTGSRLSALRYRGSGASPEDPVDVVATGFRNHYDLVFRDTDLYMSQNGPETQGNLGDDLLLRARNAPASSLAGGTAPDFGFPGCLYTHDELGWPVAEPAQTDGLPESEKTCDGVTPAIASFGLHPSANGLDFAPSTGFGSRSGDLFVAEWGSFSGFVGHKVVRVGIAPDGSVRARSDGGPDQGDFLAASGPIDLTFHSGAMYVADYFTGTVLRVVSATG
jgi:glucose/arabinose dehydrogenase